MKIDSFFNKILVDESEYADELTDADTVTKRPASMKKTRSFRKENEIIVMMPKELDDVQKIIDHLIDGDTILINLEGLKVETQLRISDMIIGYSYGSQCKIFKVTESILIASAMRIRKEEV